MPALAKAISLLRKILHCRICIQITRAIWCASYRLSVKQDFSHHLTDRTFHKTSSALHAHLLQDMQGPTGANQIWQHVV